MKLRLPCSWLMAGIVAAGPLCLGAELSGSSVITNAWAPFVETNFPFFSSVLDARSAGAAFPTNNLTPRGIVLNLGHGCWACFDVDLLRVAAIWSGNAVTPVSMAQGSWFVPGIKAPEGQEKLPRPDGEVWIANGIYPGWNTSLSFVDPRDPGVDPREVGRGPIDSSLGTFHCVRLIEGGAILDYEVRGARIQERIEARVQEGTTNVQRSFRIHGGTEPLWLFPGSPRPGLAVNVAGTDASLKKTSSTLAVQVQPSEHLRNFSVVFGMGKNPAPWEIAHERKPKIRWEGDVKTAGLLATSPGSWVIDEIPLPEQNPWRRNVRLASIAFFKDGRAAGVTFDGDVWMISGLSEDLRQVHWRRFSSGFHEPLGIAVRDDELFVFDRNGLWRLRDEDKNGEADVHELFSNRFTQTAETREFASGLAVAPDGSFVIAKGGQESSTLGRHNGSVLRISADGQTVTALGHGLRQPFIGVNPRTGLVTASDQQGHYVPATPLHLIRDNQYYGFLPLFLPKENYPEPIADPLTWIPHSINASGASQVWLAGARMGPLNDALIHLGYYRPELFVVLLNKRTPRLQAAVVSLTRDLAFPPLAGAVNPADGQLYVAGFQIWGSTAPKISGLARLRYTGAPATLPREIVPMTSGILVRFDLPLSSDATKLANFSAERWNYRRSAEYGSPHYKLDGSKGQEQLAPSSAYLSRDRKSVFVAFPDLKPVMQMRFGWSVHSEGGAEVAQNAYFTPWELATFDPEREGFPRIQIDLTPRPPAKSQTTSISIEEGKRLSELMGCIACHSTDGSTLAKVGPTWKGLFGRERTFAGGGHRIADEEYLRDSIREPSAQVVSGFEKSDTGMPSYDGILNDAQVESLVLYIKSLAD